MIPQKYCGFSTKLDMPVSKMPSSEEGGLAPKFMNLRETAMSSSVPRTDEPGRGKERQRKKKETGRCMFFFMSCFKSFYSNPGIYNSSIAHLVRQLSVLKIDVAVFLKTYGYSQQAILITAINNTAISTILKKHQNEEKNQKPFGQ